MRTETLFRPVLRLLLALTAVMVLLTACMGGHDSPLVGRTAPGFTTTWLNGDSFSLADYGGRPVLIEFWAPWCRGCIENIDTLNTIHKKYGEKLQVIALSAERGRKTLGAFIHKSGIAYPVALSTAAIINDYAAMTIPATVLVDREGSVVYHHYGVLSARQLESVVTRVL